MDKDLRKIVKALEAKGFTVTPTTKGHLRVTRNGRKVAVLSGTSSDWRAIRNAVAAMRRRQRCAKCHEIVISIALRCSASLPRFRRGFLRVRLLIKIESNTAFAHWGVGLAHR